MRSGINIKSVIHVKIPFLRNMSRKPDTLGAAEAWAQSLSNAVSLAIDAVGTRPEHLFITSTIMSSSMIETGLENDLIVNHFERNMGLTPIITCAYECAGWGYILRTALRAGLTGRFMIVINDVNIPAHSYWTFNPYWGKSGFGITVITLDLSASDMDHLVVEAHERSYALRAFRTSLARQAADRPNAIVSSPFFPMPTSRVYRAIAKIPQELDNLHDEFGHCFGSDPWIGLIVNQAQSTTNEAVIGSLALNGYFSVAALQMDPNAHLEISSVSHQEDENFQSLCIENERTEL